MYGSVVTAQGRRAPYNGGSEENILPMQNGAPLAPGKGEILKTTQVILSTDEMGLGKKRSVEDRV